MLVIWTDLSAELWNEPLLLLAPYADALAEFCEDRYWSSYRLRLLRPPPP